MYDCFLYNSGVEECTTYPVLIFIPRFKQSSEFFYDSTKAPILGQ